MGRFLKKISDGYIYPWTSELAKRTDMIECDRNGRLKAAAPGVVAETANPPALPISERTPRPVDELKDESTLRQYLTSLDKGSLEAWSKDTLSFDPDRRLSKHRMIDQVVAAAKDEGKI